MVGDCPRKPAPHSRNRLLPTEAVHREAHSALAEATYVAPTFLLENIQSIGRP